MSEEEVIETTEETSADLPAKENRDFVVAEDLEVKTQDRPEWLPEKYKTGEDLAKAYKELESKLGTKEEDLRAKFIEEVQSEAFKDRPETVGDYQLPEVEDGHYELDSNIVQWWANHSFENGFSQKEFQEGLDKISESVLSNFPNPDEEEKKLGDNSAARIEAAALFSHKFFEEKHMEAIERLTETAGGIEAIEYIMEKMKSAPVNIDSSPSGQITEQSLREMMQDERYWHPARRNSDFINEVNEGFQKLYNQ